MPTLAQRLSEERANHAEKMGRLHKRARRISALVEALRLYQGGSPGSPVADLMSALAKEATTLVGTTDAGYPGSVDDIAAGARAVGLLADSGADIGVVAQDEEE